MNERITKIVIETLGKEGVIDSRAFGHWALSDDQLEKFAELIVRECHDTIKKDMELAHIQLIPIDFGMYANGRLRRIIKTHFGIEE